MLIKTITHYSHSKKTTYYSQRNSGIMCVSLDRGQPAHACNRPVIELGGQCLSDLLRPLHVVPLGFSGTSALIKRVN